MNFLLEEAFLAKKLSDEAIEAYKKAVELDPKNANALYNLGFVLFYGGYEDEAWEIFRKALKLAPNHLDAYYIYTGQL